MKAKILNKQDVKKAFQSVDRDALSRKLGSSRNTIDQIACGLILVSAKRAKEIERETCGLIPAKLLRPDIFD